MVQPKLKIRNWCKVLVDREGNPNRESYYQPTGDFQQYKLNFGSMEVQFITESNSLIKYPFPVLIFQDKNMILFRRKVGSDSVNSARDG